MGMVKYYLKCRYPYFRTSLAFQTFFFSGGENFVALDLIVQHVHSQLEKVRRTSLGEGENITASESPIPTWLLLLVAQYLFFVIISPMDYSLPAKSYILERHPIPGRGSWVSLEFFHSRWLHPPHGFCPPISKQ